LRVGRWLLSVYSTVGWGGCGLLSSKFSIKRSSRGFFAMHVGENFLSLKVGAESEDNLKFDEA